MSRNDRNVAKVCKIVMPDLCVMIEHIANEVDIHLDQLRTF